MNRIVERFVRLKREGKKGFIVYIGGRSGFEGHAPARARL